jgi:hypothetical protein
MVRLSTGKVYHMIEFHQLEAKVPLQCTVKFQDSGPQTYHQAPLAPFYQTFRLREAPPVKCLWFLVGEVREKRRARCICLKFSKFLSILLQVKSQASEVQDTSVAHASHVNGCNEVALANMVGGAHFAISLMSTQTSTGRRKAEQMVSNWRSQCLALLVRVLS